MVIATKFSIGYMSRDAKIKVNTQGNGAKSSASFTSSKSA